MYKYKEQSFERIRRIRLLRLKYLGDTKCKEETFARLLDIEVKDLKKIESGDKTIESGKLNKLSELLGVSIEHIVEEKTTLEDLFIEPILLKYQIGSLMHGLRAERINKATKGDWRKYSLKSIAKALGISSMELKRIESLNRSSHFKNEKFLHKVSNMFDVPYNYIRGLTDSSFFRGEDRKEAVAKGPEKIRYTENTHGKRLVVLVDSLNKKEVEALKKRIEFELDILRSKPAR